VCAANYDLVEAELSLVNFTHVYNMQVLECVSPAHECVSPAHDVQGVLRVLPLTMSPLLSLIAAVYVTND
jgi:hypothetical protein